ncbi:MAG: 30S ribosomal protein S8 [Deltaproteobacteria bacterium]|nr:30S ribosomal protein S8 [Deltaproteobacteria bacterium]
MSMTDPIADLLTRIRNAIQAGHREVILPASRLKREIANALLDEGYISSFSVIDDKKQGMMKIILKYAGLRKNAITGIKRLSKPGLRRYVGKDEIPSVLNGLGTVILSTTQGILVDKKARELGVGGELICEVY